MKNPHRLSSRRLVQLSIIEVEQAEEAEEEEEEEEVAKQG